MKTTKSLSLVIPAHNESPNLLWHHKLITEFLSKKDFNYEIIYIDDGSTDNTLDILKDLVKKDKKTHYISFSKNFGKNLLLLLGSKKVREI